MRGSKQAVIAATVALAWMVSAHAEERVNEAIQSLDNGARATDTVGIGSAELARARDAGEIQTTETTADGAREYVHDAAVQSRAREQGGGPPAARAASEAVAQPRA